MQVFFKVRGGLQNNLEGTEEEQFLADFKIRSSYNIPIIYANDLYGFIVINYCNHYRALSHEDLDFLRVIAIQAGAAVYQSKIINSLKETVKREVLARKITEIIRGSLDSNLVKHNIVEEIGKIYNVDRCFIVLYDHKNKKFSKVRENEEYLPDKNLRSVVGLSYKLEKNQEAYQIKNKQSELVIKNSDDIFNSDDENYAYSYFKSLNVKTSICITMVHADEFIGRLVLDFKDKIEITDENSNFLRTIASQAAAAIYQARLYDTVQNNAKREKILREIIINLKTFDKINNIFNYILAKIAELFVANRVVFVEIPKSKYEPIRVKYEFLSDKGLLPIDEYNWDLLKSSMLIKELENSKSIVVNENSYLKEKLIENLTEAKEIKTILVSLAVMSSQDMDSTGLFLVFFKDKKEFNEEDIKFFENIINATMTVIWEVKKRIEIDELRNTFISTIAHDLQVPLVGEQKAIEYLSSKPELIKYKDLLNEIFINNKNIYKLLAQLINIYSYEAGKKKLELVNYNIILLINQSIEALKELAKSKNINLNVQINNNIPEINIDQKEILKVLNSLIQNAINYSKNNDEVIIKVSLIKENIFVCVIDNGIGISDEIKDKIFERGLMAQVLERKIGAGLSLNIAKQIIEAHNGKLWFKSQLDKGTTFCFILPI